MLLVGSTRYQTSQQWNSRLESQPLAQAWSDLRQRSPQTELRLGHPTSFLTRGKHRLGRESNSRTENITHSGAIQVQSIHPGQSQDSFVAVGSLPDLRTRQLSTLTLSHQCSHIGNCFTYRHVLQPDLSHTCNNYYSQHSGSNIMHPALFGHHFFNRVHISINHFVQKICHFVGGWWGDVFFKVGHKFHI